MLKGYLLNVEGKERRRPEIDELNDDNNVIH